MKKVAYFLGIFALVALLVEPSFAANTGNISSALQDIWNEAVSFLQGPGGALLALGSAGWGLYSFIRGGIFMGAIGLLGAVTIYRLPNAVSGIYTFTI